MRLFLLFFALFVSLLSPGLNLVCESIPTNPFLLSSPTLNAWERASFLETLNPQLENGYCLNFALLYDEEAGFEGVNPDLAFAQMILETSALRFGGQVKSGQNNFGGLGALDGGANGLVFSTPREGVRAQIQHLKFYGSTLPLRGESVNPRLSLIRRGIAPTVLQLSGSWASDPNYGKKIVEIVQRMNAHAERLRSSQNEPAAEAGAGSAVSQVAQKRVSWN